jgi:peptidoglycan/xylan/chitin deacetylase (PgdA/CDA1 family)
MTRPGELAATGASEAQSPVVLLLGVDLDRPRIGYRDVPGYLEEAAEVARYLEALGRTWDQQGFGWTFFVCGTFVRSMEETVGLDALKVILAGRPAGVEIACHTYSHHAVGKVPGRPDVPPPDRCRIEEDLARNELELGKLGPAPEGGYGFRAPYGLGPGGLVSPALEVVSAHRAYSSSELRGSRAGAYAPLSVRGVLRQPYRTSTGLWEIPSHGWHDTVFAGLSASPGGPPQGADAARRHYSRLLARAIRLADKTCRPVYLGLCLHPLALARYDPGTTMFAEIVAEARAHGPVLVCGYGAARSSLVGRADRMARRW